MNKILETDRLILRNFAMNDDNALLEIFKDGGMPQIEQRSVLDINYVHNFLRSMIESYKNNEFGIWAVVEKRTEKLIGWCGLHWIKIKFDGEMQEQDKIEIAYRIYKNLWGKGLATEIATAVRDYAFNILKISEFICCMDSDNKSSIRVAKNIGLTYWQEGLFLKEGVFKGTPCLIYRIEKTKLDK